MLQEYQQLKISEYCGNYNQMAVDYAKSFGYAGSICFDKRKRTLVSFDLK